MGKNMTINNQIKTGCFIILSIFCLPILAQAADKTGYIDIQRIVSESTVGKEKMAAHQQLREQKESRLQEKLESIKKLNNQLNQATAREPVDQAEIPSLIEKLRIQKKEAERYAADAKEELARLDRQSVNEVLVIAAPIIMQIGEAGGYAVILRNINNIVYLGPGANITDQVIEALNKQ